MVIRALSRGHAVDATAVAKGVVHGVFDQAVNIEIDDTLWTLLARDQPDAPFGIRISRPRLGDLGLEPGDAVRSHPGRLSFGSGSTAIIVDHAAARAWRPVDRPAVEPGIWQRIDEAAAIARPLAWEGSAEMAAAVTRSLDDEVELDRVLRRVVGRGPGLTPSGDDVLVGILAVTVPDAALTRCIQPLLATTTDVSAHLLRHASAGLFGEAVLDVVHALADPASAGPLDPAARRLVRCGATSGADTVMGLVEAAARLAPTRQRTAA